MKTIKHQVEICRPQTEVFDLTQDYARRLAWDPYLVEAYLLDGADRAAVGVDAYCKNRSGSVMISRYIAFNRPETAAIQMIQGPFLLKRFSGAWNVKKVDDERSTLIFTYNFELKGGLLGRWLLPVAVLVFSRDMRQRLRAVRAYLERALSYRS